MAAIASAAGSASDGGLAVLVLLADGRLPAGGHAHSGGVEAAVADGGVRDVSTLSAYLDGRLVTTGRVDAALAVAAWVWAGSSHQPRLVGAGRLVADLRLLDGEAAARMPAPALRAASRAQGRGLLRVARRCWPSPALDLLAELHPQGPTLPVVIGAAAGAVNTGAAGAVNTGAAGAATLALWSTLGGPAWAAVRLLGLDPIEVTSVLARLTVAVDREAADAARWALRLGPLAEWVGDLPAQGAPITEIGAEDHATWEVRLFAS